MCPSKVRVKPGPGGLPLAALLVVAASVCCAAAPAPAATQGATSVSASLALEEAHFSALDELTPQNVGQLLPLLAVRGALGAARSAGLSADDARAAGTGKPLGPAASTEAHLRDFVTWRASLVQARLARAPSRSMNRMVSYVVAETRDGDHAGGRAAPDRPGRLSAWDPVRRRTVWTAAEAVPPGAGAVVTAGGLVFYCSTDGWLQALDARTGGLLWRHRLAGREDGAPFTYQGADGHQVVGVLTNVTGDTGTLQTFSLPR